MALVALVVMTGGSQVVKWLGFDPNGLAAVASAIAALAALGSATQSRDTARDAVRALSYGTKPNLSLEVIEPYMYGLEGRPILASISNNADYPVSRATLRWFLQNGERKEVALGRLEARRYVYAGASGGVASKPESYKSIVLCERGEGPVVERVELTYWGDQGPVGWKRVVEVEHDATSRGMSPRAKGSDLGETEVAW